MQRLCLHYNIFMGLHIHKDSKLLNESNHILLLQEGKWAWLGAQMCLE